jgi:hypothetical protein
MTAGPGVLIKSGLAVENGGNRHGIAILIGKFRFFSLLMALAGCSAGQQLLK